MSAIKHIGPAQLREWLNRGEAVLVDVREPDEYRYEHIEGAVNIPLASASVENLPDATGRKIVIQCGSGMRSRQACGKIQSEETLYNLDGGLKAWKEAGYNVAKIPGNRVLPLQRQVQLTVGFFVLTGVVLGYFIHPAFLLVPAFMGGGLMNAGLTGWCGMANMLALMPWNRNN